MMRKVSGEIPVAAGEPRVTEPHAPARTQHPKPPFRPVKDDTKPVLRDPISRSDPIETEQAVLRLPPCKKTQFSSNSNW